MLNINPRQIESKPYAQLRVRLLLRSTGEFIAPIFPQRVLSYIDRIVIRLRRRLTDSQIAELEQHCGSVDQRARRIPFLNFPYRLDLKQPQLEAFLLLGEWTGGLFRINHAQVALDLIFASEWEKLEAQRFHRWHFKQRGHCHPGGLRIVGHTLYSGPRHAAHVLLDYADKPCRITGDLHCLYIEWRTQGARALRSIKLTDLSSVLDFDHREFWEQRLLYRRVDAERLGRVLNARPGEPSRRTAWVQQITPRISYNFDLRRGGLLTRLHAVHDLLALERFSKLRKRIGECMTPLCVMHLLPTAEGR